MKSSSMPPQQGLYNAKYEHDACGVGFVAHIKNKKSHNIVKQGLTILCNLTHRGAAGADPDAGDGAGILIQVPHAFLLAVCADIAISLPEAGEYGVGMVFLPQNTDLRLACEKIIADIITNEGQQLLGWRDVPTDNSCLPASVRASEPVIRQVFVAHTDSDKCPDQQAFERKLFVIRKLIEHSLTALDGSDPASFYISSFSSRTLVYKGMFLSHQVEEYYPDVKDERMVSALCLAHQRFSTNTFPAWELAHPFRMVAHNGEINTLRGNINWMNARRKSMQSDILGDDLDKLWPLIVEGQSDSAGFDNALELLVAGGYSLAHAAMLLIPEAWAGNDLMDAQRKAFYEYHAALMEPWDGPAAVAFTDGRQIGATLDRNGLRPARYVITNDDLVVMASEVGVLSIAEDNIKRKWRLQPGKMFLIDLEEGFIIRDEQLKSELSEALPYEQWLQSTQIHVEKLAADVFPMAPDAATLLDRQQAFGYTQEEFRFLILPMARTGQESIGSMGNDSPLAVLSERAKTPYHYFKQLFAQVTNPAIDPIREEMVMSLISIIGPRPNLLGLNHNEELPKRLEVRQPILKSEDLQKIRRIEHYTNGAFRTRTLSMCFAIPKNSNNDKGNSHTMAAALDVLCQQAEKAVREKHNIIMLSDRKMDVGHAAIPALLATSAVHHHLIREGLRTKTGLVIETGSAREVHHFCLLAGFGAEAINPYLVFESLAGAHRDGLLPEVQNSEEAVTRYIKAVNKGMLKVMSKMGISTYQSYCGAQIFEAIGLNHDFIDRYFTGTATQIEGIGLPEIAREAMRLHRLAYGNEPLYRDALDVGGEYAWRVRGDHHLLSPDAIAKVQHAARSNDYTTYKEYARIIDKQAERLLTLRGLFKFNIQQYNQKHSALALEEVESVDAIVQRFVTGAMSFGSISREAHTTLAIAMNRLGAKSNTGEGGEEPERFVPMANGDSMRSAIKQVASGRFGVTIEYLVNADEIQIKVAQGAKPGEGGQLPGHKVKKHIAAVRHSTPGVGLISPPPHHDIYSIEDLAQLIFDLKNANPAADISVKLVSEIGVGTIAAGVVKGHADHVTISGHDGGTGASALTSIKHAGTPWELGLAETQQTLVLNRLRGRMRLQVDGQMRTGRDVIIAAILGADEFGFGTIALVMMGCIMMRKCHLNTCPVGVATQDETLRTRFNGDAEHVVNYFRFVAREVREYMAELGVRNINDLIGRTDLLDIDTAVGHWKTLGLDLSPILNPPTPAAGVAIHKQEGVKQNHGIDNVLDRRLIIASMPALERKERVEMQFTVRNTDRTIGGMLSGEIAKRYGLLGLPEDTINIRLEGTAGQSFGAWLARGITLTLHGDANDYVGKGLCGGRIIIAPQATSNIAANAADNIIIGNTVLYGAVAGECYFSGVAGERFGVRNSGAVAIVEGVGDHGCEYMTGGTVVVLGDTGRNFAAGMSGGVAYVLDESGDFETRCNLTMVELEPILSEDDVLEATEHQGGDLETHGRVDIKHSLSQNDKLILRLLIGRHAQYTNSIKAQYILDNWQKYIVQFVKIMPVDYRRALREMEIEQQEQAIPVN